MKSIYKILTLIILLICLGFIWYNVYQRYYNSNPIVGTTELKTMRLSALPGQKITSKTVMTHLNLDLGYKPHVRAFMGGTTIELPYSFQVTNEDDGVTTKVSIDYEVYNDSIVFIQRVVYDGGYGRTLYEGGQKIDYKLTRPLLR